MSWWTSGARPWALMPSMPRRACRCGQHASPSRARACPRQSFRGTGVHCFSCSGVCTRPALHAVLWVLLALFYSRTGSRTYRPETASALLASARRLMSHYLLCSKLTSKGQYGHYVCYYVIYMHLHNRLDAAAGTS